MFYVFDNTKIIGKFELRIREKIIEIKPRLQVDRMLFRKNMNYTKYRIVQMKYYFVYDGSFHFYQEKMEPFCNKNFNEESFKGKLLREIDLYLENNDLDKEDIKIIIK